MSRVIRGILWQQDYLYVTSGQHLLGLMTEAPKY